MTALRSRGIFYLVIGGAMEQGNTGAMASDYDGQKLIAQNKKAWHDYFIEDTIEAGMVLRGTEVKSVRLGNANLKESYVEIKNEEIFVNGMHISPYEKGNIYNSDPLRVRKLLLHKKEIRRLASLTQQKGMALVPLKIYFKDGIIKMEIGVAKGKKLFDKREAIAEKDAQRDIERKLKDGTKGY
jgi:SsrA-binding protein